MISNLKQSTNAALLDGPLSVGAATMGNDIYGGELISSEADDLRIENQQLYGLIVQLILDLNDLEDTCGPAVITRGDSTW
jgi:hypothetical protein